jgi:hypothetical protein
MTSASQLSDEQKKTMAEWAEQGASIADIQRRLKEEFALGVTYMEARFIVLDLGLKLHEEPKNEEKKEPVEPAPADSPDDGAAPAPPADGVSVSIDDLALPGAIVSGKVTFRDGQTAVWMLDQFGRPSLDPDTAGYRPPEADVLDFQRQLQILLQKRGF